MAEKKKRKPSIADQRKRVANKKSSVKTRANGEPKAISRKILDEHELYQPLLDLLVERMMDPVSFPFPRKLRQLIDEYQAASPVLKHYNEMSIWLKNAIVKDARLQFGRQLKSQGLLDTMMAAIYQRGAFGIPGDTNGATQFNYVKLMAECDPNHPKYAAGKPASDQTYTPEDYAAGMANFQEQVAQTVVDEELE